MTINRADTAARLAAAAKTELSKLDAVNAFDATVRFDGTEDYWGAFRDISGDHTLSTDRLCLSAGIRASRLMDGSRWLVPYGDWHERAQAQSAVLRELADIDGSAFWGCDPVARWVREISSRKHGLSGVLMWAERAYEAANVAVSRCMSAIVERGNFLYDGILDTEQQLREEFVDPSSVDSNGNASIFVDGAHYCSGHGMDPLAVVNMYWLINHIAHVSVPGGGRDGNPDLAHFRYLSWQLGENLSNVRRCAWEGSQYERILVVEDCRALLSAVSQTNA